ncbi:MAG: hypothetical protein IKS41_04240 [Alphaproteobacteria bacterium]|nr:hypothetical protein [Alphaproteobacteria bacterium]
MEFGYNLSLMRNAFIRHNGLAVTERALDSADKAAIFILIAGNLNITNLILMKNVF